jgi:chemotaxis protein CheY-P-specific phosphatase CheC
MQGIDVETAFSTFHGRICEQLGQLLQTECTVASEQTKSFRSRESFGYLNSPSVVAQLAMPQAGEAEGYILLSAQDAVALGAALRGEDISQEIEEGRELQDEDSEALERIFETLLSQLQDGIASLTGNEADISVQQWQTAGPGGENAQGSQYAFAPGEYIFDSCRLNVGPRTCYLEIYLPSSILTTLREQEFEKIGSAAVTAEEPGDGDGSASAQEETEAREEQAGQEGAEEGDGPAEEEAPASGEEPAAEQAAQDDEQEQQESSRKKVKPATVRNAFDNGTSQVEEELGALLGDVCNLTERVHRVTTKQEFIEQFQNKLVVTDIAVSGDHYGSAYVCVSLQDAIFLGSTLILLPEEEIESKIKKGMFKEEESDAFGEVINILVGAYSNAFGDYFPYKLRLKKDRMTTISPVKVDMESQEPFPEDEYYHASYQIHFGTKELGQLDFLFPASILNLDPEPVQELRKVPLTGEEDSGKDRGSKSIYVPGDGAANPAIAVISEDEQQRETFTEVLSDQEDLVLCGLNLKDNFKDKLRQYNVIGAFLIVSELSEQNLANLIKIRSLLKGRCPIILAGPQWTRSKVIKAVRYGASDIISTPPDPQSILQKFEQHMTNGG